jgi:ABC-type amino acid transport substrate-binding protein
MGAVYRAWQKSLDRCVAIKILPPGLAGHDASFVERFKREAKAMARLKHPGIVAVYDAGETADGLLYFVMECIEGTDLQHLIGSRCRIAAAEALEIAARVCEALGYAHLQGIVHRDIKPSNILIGEGNVVKVTDFGLVKSTRPDSSTLTLSNMPMGTFDFMAPEALQDASSVDLRADLYAVGVVLYQMLTGKLPRGRFELPSQLSPDLDRNVDRILDRALKIEREDRYPDAAEFLADIETVRGRAKAGASMVARRVVRPKSQRRVRAMLAAGAVALVGLLAVLLFSSRLRPEAGRIALQAPPAGASLTGGLLLSWSGDGLEPANLSFDVAIASEGKPPTVKRVGGNSLVPTEVEGTVRWKVRPVWQQSPAAEKVGPWSEEKEFTYFPNSLRRIVATHTVVVGMGEDDGIFLIHDEYGLRGAEIDLLRAIFTQILREHGVREKLAITSKEKVWGAGFLQLLDTDSSVDLLASGISITESRRKQFAMDFTDPTFEYYQSLITRAPMLGFRAGMIAVDPIGVVEHTSNETYARGVLGASADEHLSVYRNSGAYDQMLNDLVAGKIDGVLMDKPYALQKIAERKKHNAENGVVLTPWDVSAVNQPGATMEKVGFAVRKSDQLLLREINAQLATMKDARRGLLKKYVPDWND